VEAGVQPSKGLTLSRTLEQLRTIAADPCCTRVIGEVHGEPVTAVGVQRHYLECVRRNLGRAFMPGWAPEVCALWESTLTRLGSGAPASVAGTLDWAMKHAVFGDYFERCGWTRDAIPVLALVANWFPSSMLSLSAPPGGKFGRMPLDPERVEMASRHLSGNGLSLEDFDRYLQDRNRLYEADIRWGEIGGDSIFRRLDSQGRLDHEVADLGDVVAAQHEPPVRGRGALCDWEAIVAGGQRLELSDPLTETEGEWVDVPKAREGERDGTVDALLGRLTSFID
jgi:hypothetical protein